MNPDPGDAPFLSFLLPTGPGREQALDETLLSLAAQTVTDFEVIVLTDADGAFLEALRVRLDEHPPTLRQRTSIVAARGSRAEMLNAGLAAARGSHVAVSDDITWLGHWIETAREADRATPGRCIRGLVLEQDVSAAQVGGSTGIRAEAAPVRAGSERFHLYEHVSEPLASTYGVAMPRSVLAEHGLLFDETMGSAAVRRLLLAAVSFADVVETGEVVAIHQRLTAEQAEAVEDLARLVKAVDAEQWVSPTGSATSASQLAKALHEQGHGPDAPSADHRSVVKLKDDHISNLEAIIEQREARISRLEEQLAKRTAQIEKLRAKVRATTPKDQGEDKPRFWRRG